MFKTRSTISDFVTSKAKYQVKLLVSILKLSKLHGFFIYRINFNFAF